MIEINGKCCVAKVFTDNIEETAVNQIRLLCDQEFTDNAKVRIMPDVHAGAGCVIGFTADLGDKVIPKIVGVDIGCGMLTVKLRSIDFSLEMLDNVIGKYVPSGKNVHEGRLCSFAELKQLNCYRYLKDTKRIERSLGTLGGGNHFIEINKDEQVDKYLVIHSGSRNLGKQVADFYQDLAYELLCGKDKYFDEKAELIAQYKQDGRKSELQDALKKLKVEYKENTINLPKELAYLSGEYRDDYLHDMAICQNFAMANRKMIATIILNKMFDKSLDDFQYLETVHNYIDHQKNIIRKGAVSAKRDEELLIPINMRDGSLLCVGKGNEDWNCSAPHGAGRLMSRNQAKEKFSVDEFKASMEGIYSSSININTLDECPMAYKGMDEIIANIKPTAEIMKIIKPIYNFKAQN